MDNRYMILLIFSLAICVLTGCAEKCDDFNMDITEWMPYQQNEKVVIEKDTETDTLVVNSCEIYHTDKIRNRTSCSCENSYTVELASESLTVDILFNNSNEVENSDIQINDDWLSYSERYDKLEINGKEYDDVIVYVNENNTPGSQIMSIAISKSIGIVSITGPYGNWKIQNDSKKNVDRSQIKIKSTNC